MWAKGSRRNSSTVCSLVRIENARIDNVVVLSVQFRNTLASETNRFDTLWVWANRFVTDVLVAAHSSNVNWE